MAGTPFRLSSRVSLDLLAGCPAFDLNGVLRLAKKECPLICYLGVGANLGNRRENISSAIKKICSLKDTKLIKASKIIETKPVGGPAGQGKFLNAVLKIKTEFEPLKLLEELKKIEKELGRTRNYIRFGPRTIDLDILFYADKVINRKDLKIPHPKIFEREFVVEPLLEVIESG